MVTSNMDTLVETWQEYLKTVNWQELIKGVDPKQTDCGPVFELDNPLDRPSENLAIADMRGIALAGPHYHTGGESEIYFVLEG